MSDTSQDLLQIKSALRTLAMRVQALEARDPLAPLPAAALGGEPRKESMPARLPVSARAGVGARREGGDSSESTPPALGDRVSDIKPALAAGGGEFLATVVAGMTAIDQLADIKGYPRFFAQLAQNHALRMLLLKRWSSGLQILHAEGLALPRQLPGDQGSGAPAVDRIATRDGDLFTALTIDQTVYAGRVPIKHFPLDLSLLLGKGQQRHIVVWPLPLRGRWNTFIYIDGDHAHERALAAVEILARYSLLRLRLLERSIDLPKPSRTIEILELEMERHRFVAKDAAPVATDPSRDRAVRPTATASKPSSVDAAGSATARAPSVHRQPLAAPEDRRPGPRTPAPPTSPSSKPAPDPAVAGALAAIFDEGRRAVAADPGLLVTGEAPRRGPADPPQVVLDEPSLALAPRQILARVGDLPPLPRVAQHILALIADPNTTAGKLEKAIVLDQALTAKVLKIANSSFYGGLRDVNTVGEAIVRLGFITIRNWTLATAARSVFVDAESAPLLQKIWQQSVVSAMASQLVAEHLRHPNPEAVFVGGLMQNIGQLALAKALPDVFRQVVETSGQVKVPYHLVERDQLGFDHGDLGALLIREWNLSGELEEAVRRHHRLELQFGDAADRLAALIALGEEIAQCSGDAPDDEQALWENSQAARRLEISEVDYVDLVERARRLRVDPRLFA